MAITDRNVAITNNSSSVPPRIDLNISLNCHIAYSSRKSITNYSSYVQATLNVNIIHCKIFHHSW